MLSSQQFLKERYRITDVIGVGGFGTVYKAEDIQFVNRTVAIKEMSQEGLSAQEVEAKTGIFRREAMLLAGLTHPALPRIYDHFTTMGRWYLVMDFIEGETLEARLQRTPRLPLDEVLTIGIQLCTVLDYLHTRQPIIIFRDLKPSNIMLTAQGHLYLIDFGIARHFKPEQAKDTVPFGSPGYAAPEQYGKMQTTIRADVYSLGAILHQLLTGSDPVYNEPTPFHFAPLDTWLLPQELKTLILQMLDMDERKRPVNLGIVKQQLQTIGSISKDVAQNVSEQLQNLLFGVLTARNDMKMFPHPITIEHPAMPEEGLQQEQSKGQILLGIPKIQKQRKQQSFSRREMVLSLLGATGLIMGGGDIVSRLWQQRSEQRTLSMNLPKEPINLSFAQGTVGWSLTGSSPQDYAYGSEVQGLTSTSACGYLKSRTTQAGGFGTLTQAFKGNEYLRKRLRFSAYVKTQDVEQWVGLWMCVYASYQRVLSFDNMQGRPIRGTNDWRKYEIVLDVPQESIIISFGVLLAGAGYTWLSDVQFETVSESVPTTGS